MTPVLVIMLPFARERLPETKVLEKRHSLEVGGISYTRDRPPGQSKVM